MKNNLAFCILRTIYVLQAPCLDCSSLMIYKRQNTTFCSFYYSGLSVEHNGVLRLWWLNMLMLTVWPPFVKSRIPNTLLVFLFCSLHAISSFSHAPLSAASPTTFPSQSQHIPHVYIPWHPMLFPPVQCQPTINEVHWFTFSVETFSMPTTPVRNRGT